MSSLFLTVSCFVSALPPSTTVQAADPWGAPTGYGAPVPPAAPYGDPDISLALTYGAPSGGFGYGAPPQAPSPAGYGAPPQDPFGAPAPQQVPPSNPYGAPPQQQQQQQPPQQPQQMYGQPPAQAPYQAQPNPFGTPGPSTVSAGIDYTPASSIGFASPMGQQYQAPAPAPEPMGQQFQPMVQQFEAPAPAEPAEYQSSDPALMSMNVLSGQAPSLVSSEPQSNGTAGGSMADQAYAKLVNMDAFDLVKDKKEQKNPFDFGSSSSVNTASLADMKKSNSVSPLTLISSLDFRRRDC